MTKLRRYKAFYIRTGEDVGIGIVEHGEKWDNETKAIHSIYSENNLSNRDAYIIIMQTIFYDMADDEWALLYMSQASRGKGWHKPYANKIRVEKASYERGSMFQAQLLALDSLKRKTSITERFDEPMRFSVIQQEKEENEG